MYVCVCVHAGQQSDIMDLDIDSTRESLEQLKLAEKPRLSLKARQRLSVKSKKRLASTKSSPLTERGEGGRRPHESRSLSPPAVRERKGVRREGEGKGVRREGEGKGVRREGEGEGAEQVDRGQGTSCECASLFAIPERSGGSGQLSDPLPLSLSGSLEK